MESANMLTFGTKMFGCNFFTESQISSCEEVPSEMEVERNLKVMLEYYDMIDVNVTESVIQSIFEKKDSHKVWRRFLRKYPQSIRFVGRRAEADGKNLSKK